MYPFWLIESEANKFNISIRTGCFCNLGIDEVSHQIEADQLAYYFEHQPQHANYKHMMEQLGKLRGAVRLSVGFITTFTDVIAFYTFAKRFINKAQ